MSAREAINRRKFLSNIGIGAAGTFGSGLIEPNPKAIYNGQILPLSKREKNINPRDIKINVKPVSGYMIHGGVWTGPCRWNPNPPPEEEKVQFRERFENSINNYKNNLSKDVKILKPVYIEYSEAAGFGDKQLKKLETDYEEVDLYLASGNVYPQYPGSLIGERFVNCDPI